MLMEFWKDNQNPNKAEIRELAKRIGLTAMQVDTWFVNRRHAEKVRINTISYSRVFWQRQ